VAAAEQCADINRFVAVFAVPLLSFTFFASNNLYRMNYRFLAADTIQKASLLLSKTPLLRRRCLLLLLVGLGDHALLPLHPPQHPGRRDPAPRRHVQRLHLPLMVQIVVLQSIVWYTILLALFEYRAAVPFIADQFPAPGTAARISSVRVDPDMVSLSSSSGGQHR
ncbi:unnamed protein product, partial [Linum tenue]